MPNISFVVCIKSAEVRIINPMPASAAIISAATTNNKAMPMPNLSPANIIGRALGKMTLYIIRRRLEPKEMAALISTGSAFRTPVYTLITMGKNTPNPITVIFEYSPIPSHNMSRGRIAILGMG